MEALELALDALAVGAVGQELVRRGHAVIVVPHCVLARADELANADARGVLASLGIVVGAVEEAERPFSRLVLLRGVAEDELGFALLLLEEVGDAGVLEDAADESEV